MAIASLIIGILIFPITFILGLVVPFTSVVGVVMCIVGLVLGILALRRETRRRIAIAGIVLNSLGVLWLIVGFSLFAAGL